MRKRCNPESAVDEPPEKKSFTSSSVTVDVKPGTSLIDILGKKWKLGKTVGTGGFGRIYLVSDNINEDVNNAQYVCKVETHKSGPLFVERNCYLLIAKEDMINEWKENNKVEHLGMPHYVASGSHNTGGNKYRFLIIPRFAKDLDAMFEAKKRKFNLKTVLAIALQTIDVLQYIHSKGYVHSDIKASNILLDINKTKIRSPTVSPVPKIRAVRYYGCTPIRSCKVRKISRSLRPNMNLHYLWEEEEVVEKKVIVSNNRNNIDKIYLLDYGLASKYVSTQGEHKPFCSDIRKAHAGTVLFCSRDAHEGAQSRRSDLECLGYNLIYWLTSNLPWSEDTEDPEKVHQKKNKCIENLKAFLDYTFNYQCPRFLFDYFSYLQKLEFDAEPDYNYCKTLFKNAIKEYGYKDNLLLDFDNLEGWGRKQKKVKRNSENLKIKQGVLKFKRSPLKSNLPINLTPPPKPTLRRKTNKKMVLKMKWSRILDPEIIMKQAKSRERKMTESSDSNPPPSSPMSVLELNQLNPTMAMKDVFNKSRDRQSYSGGTSPRYRGDTAIGYIESYTPAMMEVYTRKKEREELELEQLILNSKSRSRSNSRSQIKGQTVNKSKKKQSTARNRAQKQTPPPRTRHGKSQPNTAVSKKETPKQTKTIPLRRTYSLRG